MSTPDDIAIYRMKDDGTPRDVAGDEGKILVDLGGEEQVLAAELTQTQHVVVTGTREDQLFAAQINADAGHLESGFGAGAGWILPPLGPSNSSGEALAIDPAGSIFITGWVEAFSDRDLVLLKLTSTGEMDPSFGTAGHVILEREGSQQGVALAIQPDGRIVVAGETDVGGSRAVVVLRSPPTAGCSSLVPARTSPSKASSRGRGTDAPSRPLHSGTRPGLDALHTSCNLLP